MNKFLSGVLASTMILSTLGTSFAQENSNSTTETEVLQEFQQETLTSGKCGANITWSFNSSTGALVLSGTGAMYDYDYNTMPWYSYGGNIKTVVIGEGITTIGKHAFAWCNALTSVSIPNSVTSIGNYAFWYCTSLDTVFIPSSVRTIGDGVFHYYSSDVGPASTLPNVTVYSFADSYTQTWCKNTIMDGQVAPVPFIAVDSVPSWAQSSTSTSGKCGDNAYASFDPTTGTLTISGTGDTWDNFNENGSIGSDMPWDSYADKVTIIIFEEGITRIGDYLFENCTNVETVLRSGHLVIGWHALDFGSGTMTTGICGPTADFRFDSSTGTLYITGTGEINGHILTWPYWFKYADKIKTLVIQDGITVIGRENFFRSSLTSVTIPNSVTSIEDSAFYNSSSLTTVYYGGSQADRGKISIDSNNDDLENATWIYNSTGIGTTSTPTYSISASTSSNGSIKLNQTTASEGERVTLSVTANSGYMIDSVLVKDSSGNSITCGYDWVDGVYTFLMPAGNVTITANFSKIPTTTYTPTITTTGQGNASLSTSKPSAGDVVKITVSPSTGYVISSVTVKDSSGNDILCVKVSDGVYQYTQPSGNVTIYVTYYFAQNVVESYTDINYADWYAAYASYAIENGLMNGTSVGYFDPYIPVSRGMVAVILASASGESIPTANGNQFTDVQAGLWYSNAIEWCKSKNIVAGYEDGRFGVDDAITREQMVTILRGFANYMGYDSNIYFPERLSAYTDSTKVASYARDPFSWALGLNYIQGDGNQIKPQDNATRAEFANLLNYFMESN